MSVMIADTLCTNCAETSPNYGGVVKHFCIPIGRHLSFHW